MIQLVVVAVVALILAGCQTGADLEATFERKCAIYELTSDPDDFTFCVIKHEIDHERGTSRGPRRAISPNPELAQDKASSPA